MTDYHIPVMLDECIKGLEIKPNGTYVDVTYGSGGHSKPILKRLDAKGCLIAFDQDSDALENVVDDNRLELVHANFRYVAQYLKYLSIDKIDGVLADLGVSSHQFDTAQRGFSFRYDGPLDMRMSTDIIRNAADILNTYSAHQLQNVLSNYGEVRNAKTLARAIIKRRSKSNFFQMADLVECVESVSMGHPEKYKTQVFQALRIEVNDEMGALKEFLTSIFDYLTTGTRVVVMSYHSLEDRLIKRWMKTGNPEGKMVRDEYGKVERPFELINKKVIVASDSEVSRNRRARSAKLRVAERK